MKFKPLRRLMAIMALLLFPAAGIVTMPAETVASAPLGLPPVPVPEDNPITAPKVELGKRLFEDKRFSADGTVSCATCHVPEKAFTDGLPLAKGIGGQTGVRNTPTVVNAAYYTRQFWDGRAKDLEEQAKGPFLNPVEHGLKDFGPILSICASDPYYRNMFKKVFGIEPGAATIDHVVAAIAAFERTVVSGTSPFDRYLYGKDKDAISEAAKRGLEIFRTKGRCQDCHRIEQDSATFTDNKFHNLGVGFSVIEPRLFDIVEEYKRAKAEGRKPNPELVDEKAISELGRFAVTLDIQDIGRFKTPTLRNIAVTAPYMHDGSVESLEDVIELYDQGGEENPMLDSGIRPLNLTDQEKADLVEFMKSLTSPEYADIN